MGWAFKPTTTALDNEIQTLKNEKAALTNQITNLNSDITTLNNDKLALISRKNNLTEKIEKIKNLKIEKLNCDIENSNII